MKKINILCIVIIALLFFLTVNVSAQWVKTSLHDHFIYCLTVNGRDLFAGTGSVFLSTDDGSSWTAIDSGLPANVGITALAFYGENLFAGSGNSRVFLSTNYGTSWTSSDSGLPWGVTITSFAINGTYLYAGGESGFYSKNFSSGGEGGVFLSTNDGRSWAAVDSGFMDKNVLCLVLSGTNLFAGTVFGIYRTMDSARSWEIVNSGLTNTYVLSLAISGENLYAGTYRGGIFLSTNNGTHWSAINSGLPDSTGVSAIVVSGTNLFIGTWTSTGGAIYQSTNNGAQWIDVSAGLADDEPINSLAVTDSFLFAGTFSGVWRRPLSQMITPVKTISSELPRNFNLNQNYPNPFNPSTKIRFEVPVSGIASLKVYNLLGQEVATLVNEMKQPGRYEVTWDAVGLSSGVYCYQLVAGSYIKTKKLILMR